MSLISMFHPIVAFYYIKKDREKFHYAPIFLLLFLLVAGRIFSIYVTHFPLATIQPRDANIFLESIKLLLPILTWALASYAMTTILDGESLFRETLMATTYSLMPYIVFIGPVTLFSRILETDMAALYTGLHTVIWLWVFVLFFISLKEMNNYTIKKTVIVSLLSVFTMVLIWATFALFFAISAQFFSFIQEVFIEVKFKFL